MEIFLVVLIFGVLFVSVLLGLISGFLRTMLSMLAFIIAIVVVAVFSPHVTKWLKDSTPVGGTVRSAVSKCVPEFLEVDLEGVLSEHWETVQAALSGAFGELDGDGAAAELLGGSFGELPDWLPSYLEKVRLSGEDVSSGELAQGIEKEALSHTVFLPFIQKALLKHQTQEEYDRLGVSNFRDYTVSFLSDRIMGLLGILLTFIITFIAIRLLMLAFGIVNHIPGVNHVNRAAGGLVGLIRGLVIVCLIYGLISVMSATQLGQEAMAAIAGNPFLSFTYSISLKLMSLVL